MYYKCYNIGTIILMSSANTRKPYGNGDAKAIQTLISFINI